MQNLEISRQIPRKAYFQVFRGWGAPKFQISKLDFKEIIIFHDNNCYNIYTDIKNKIANLVPHQKHRMHFVQNI